MAPAPMPYPRGILVSSEAITQKHDVNPRVPLGLRNGSATFIIAIVGVLTANIVPLVMTVFTDRLGFSLIDTGQIVTWSLAGSAIVGLGTARWATGERRRTIGACGLAVATIGYSAAAIASVPSVVIAGFVIAGFGSGAALSSSGAAMAAIRNPNRVSAAYGFINRVLVMVALVTLPLIGLAQVTVFGALAVTS